MTISRTKEALYYTFCLTIHAICAGLVYLSLIAAGVL